MSTQVASVPVNIDNLQPTRQCVDEDDDSDFEKFLIKPNLINKGDLNNLVHDWNLSKHQSELLESRLKSLEFST